MHKQAVLLWDVSIGKYTFQVWGIAHSDVWSWAHVVVQLGGVFVPLDVHSNIESFDSVQIAIKQHNNG